MRVPCRDIGCMLADRAPAPSRMRLDRKTLEKPPRWRRPRTPFRGGSASARRSSIFDGSGTTTEDARSPLPGRRQPIVSARRIDEAAADAAPGRLRLLLVDRDEVAGRQLQRQLHEFGAGFEV